MNNNSTNKNITRSLFRLCSTAFLIAVLMFAYISTTLGWFSQNSEVSASGIGVISDHLDISVEYFCCETDHTNGENWTGHDSDGDCWEKIENWEQLGKFDLHPGESVYIKAVYTNNETSSYIGNTYFVPVEEVPLVETITVTNTSTDPETTSQKEQFYYLGSQLYLSSLKVGEKGEMQTPDTTNAENFLVPYTLNNKTAPVLCFDDTITAGNTTICNEFTVPAKSGENAGLFTIEFSITFINLAENQNNYKYKNFGTVGKCSRQIYTDFEEVKDTP